MNMIYLDADERQLEFKPVKLDFHGHDLTDVFAAKNNKTVSETLAAPRYSHLAYEVRARYPQFWNKALGTFLFTLKSAGDEFYKRFLNPYGDERYCWFTIAECLKEKGLYCYVMAETILYIGRCRDSFGKRINQGYGQIYPKNCYLDGQSTNCHLNTLINQNWEAIALSVCPLERNVEIEKLEQYLIALRQPEWNIQLR